MSRVSRVTCHECCHECCPAAVQEERGPRKLSAKLWRPQLHSSSCPAPAPPPSLGQPAPAPVTSSEVVLHCLARCAAHPALALLPALVRSAEADIIRKPYKIFLFMGRAPLVTALLPPLFTLLASLASRHSAMPVFLFVEPRVAAVRDQVLLLALDKDEV